MANRANDKSKQPALKDANAYISRGDSWCDKQDHDKAICDYTEAIRLDPNLAYAYYLRALSWYAKQDYDKAIQDLTEAIRRDAKYSAAFNNRGSAWHAKQEYDKAIKDYTEAIRLNPKYSAALNNRGGAWQEKQEYDKAIMDFTEAIRLEPKYSAAFNNRGNAWEKKQEYDKAAKDYSEAIRIDPNDANTFYNRGNALTELKKYDKAIEDYTEAIRIDPGYANAYYNRGTIWDEKQDYDKAIQDYNEAIRLNPNEQGHLKTRVQALKSKSEKIEKLFVKDQEKSSFQTLITGLCYRNQVECGSPPKVPLNFGMLTALEEGLRGETDNFSVEDVLASSLDFNNPFYICPMELNAHTSGLGKSTGEISSAFAILGFVKSSLCQPGPFKMFIVDDLIKGLNNLLAQRGQKILANQESYEGLLAIAYKMGLLCFHENQLAALEFAKEPRPPNPYATRK